MIREPRAQLLIEPGYPLIEFTLIVIAGVARLEHHKGRGGVSRLIHCENRKIEAHQLIFHPLTGGPLTAAVGSGSRPASILHCRRSHWMPSLTR